MKTKKLFKKIEEHIDDRVSKAYGDGFDDGYNHAIGDVDLAFRNGIEAERNRVIGLFKMLSEQELLNGSGQKAKSYREAADLVAVANHMEQLDWSQEGIDKEYYEDLDKEGF